MPLVYGYDDGTGTPAGGSIRPPDAREAPVPRIDGILETALYVADPDRSARFFRDVFGFEPVVVGDRLTALRVADRQVLLLFRKRASADLPAAAHDGEGRLHVAFAIPAEDVAAWASRLAALGVAVEETKVWDLGGTSLYFRDPDGHLLEVATPGVWPTVY
jgi:catechol 2,3-dioxygenase-like lactoylglutathione lyase family enzyme